MDVVYSHVCGFNVHKKNIVACAITPKGKEIRTFETMTDDLILLADCLTVNPWASIFFIQYSTEDVEEVR